MELIVIVTADERDIEAVLVAEAVRQAAQTAKCTVAIETHISHGILGKLTEETLSAARNVLLVGKTNTASDRFRHAHVTQRTLKQVLHDPLGAVTASLANSPTPAPTSSPAPMPATRIVAVTSCPTGVAHTFMAAEGLEQAAKALGVAIRIETQGSVGAQSTLSAAEIAAADVVIIAADREVELARFAGKRLYKSGTKRAINDGKQLIQTAIADAQPYHTGANTTTVPTGINTAAMGSNLYKHIMNGISFMLPFITAGGMLSALLFLVSNGQSMGTAAPTGFAHWLTVLAQIAQQLSIPIFAAYIAYSIADRPGLAPGMVSGAIAAQTNAGFIGAIAAGLMTGYLMVGLNRLFAFPKSLSGIKPVLVLPLVGTLITGVIMAYIVAPPIHTFMEALTQWLTHLQGSRSLFLGLILGAMMAIDMGGPINKAAYAFAVGLLATHVYTPMAAVMVAGMTPPIGVGLAALLFRQRFTEQEIAAAPSALIMGCIFISEGAIPYAARDPLRTLPALIAGSAVAGAIAFVNQITLPVPHGGLFVFATVNQPLLYCVALLAGSLTTLTVLAVMKRPLVVPAAAQQAVQTA